MPVASHFFVRISLEELSDRRTWPDRLRRRLDAAKAAGRGTQGKCDRGRAAALRAPACHYPGPQRQARAFAGVGTRFEAKGGRASRHRPRRGYHLFFFFKQKTAYEIEPRDDP